MLVPFVVIVVCAAAIIGGLALAGVAPGIGAGIALAGLVALAGFLVFVWIKAWRNNQGDYYTPGRGYREYKKEQQAAKEAAKGSTKVPPR